MLVHFRQTFVVGEPLQTRYQRPLRRVEFRRRQVRLRAAVLAAHAPSHLGHGLLRDGLCAFNGGGLHRSIAIFLELRLGRDDTFLLRLYQHRVDGRLLRGQHQSANYFPHGYLGLLDRDFLPRFERDVCGKRFASSGNLRGVGFRTRLRGDLALPDLQERFRFVLGVFVDRGLRFCDHVGDGLGVVLLQSLGLVRERSQQRRCGGGGPAQYGRRRLVLGLPQLRGGHGLVRREALL
mmetsp:Transcript_24456/g.68819  ORF Transcript_24456/g.68819 Transcript_24456/m.68819 type:complete len:236 (-) Transcript_24456:157-864(-)